ncbi:MAG: hypothetical protein ACREFX_11045 [Opitutaceae bacterium]
MRPGVVLFGTLVLLWALVEQANHLIAPLHISLFLGGLYLTYAALVFPPRIAGPVVFLAGLVCDANGFLPFGTEAFLFLGAQTLLAHQRDRLPHEDTLGRVAIAWLCNLVLFLAISLVRADHAPLLRAYWTRAAADLVVSQLVLAFTAPWFFALQSAALDRAGGTSFRRL